MADSIHIVCFDAPAPANYGGAIDLYSKVQALASTGLNITLHYFQYREGRGHEGLDAFCRNIHVYPRKKLRSCLASPLPFIVASRINKTLVARLNADDDPVLLEGMHCTGLLPYLRPGKRVVLRLHNNEAVYYRTLAQYEQRPLRNLYYLTEANRLDRYQLQLPHQLPAAALAHTDLLHFSGKYGWENVSLVPAFVPWQQARFKSYAEPYCLYHGNLSVSENLAAVRWLMRYVFTDGSAHLMVAGSNPPESLRHEVARHPHTTLEANPTPAYLEQLIGKAQVNILPSLNATGVKIKLLHALFRGRHVLANSAAVTGSGLEAGVHMAEDPATIRQMIGELMNRPFGPREMQERTYLLKPYDNTDNALKLKEMLFPGSR